MNDEVLLTLHCPECRQLVEVVNVGDDLVCLECGWKFDQEVVAKILGRGSEVQSPAVPCQEARAKLAH
jgi:hypothetical protein